jgi:hypothetical protein
MSNRGFLILVLVAAVIATVIALVAIFPEAVSSESSLMQAIYLMTILTLVGSNLIIRRIPINFALKATVTWLSIGLIVILVYRFYNAA